MTARGRIHGDPRGETMSKALLPCGSQFPLIWKEGRQVDLEHRSQSAGREHVSPVHNVLQGGWLVPAEGGGQSRPRRCPAPSIPPVAALGRGPFALLADENAEAQSGQVALFGVPEQ